MKLSIKVVTTGHYDDKGSEAAILLFTNDESEHEIIESMIELYWMEDEPGLPNELTWEWLEEQIGSFAWWNIEVREFDVAITPAERS